jgi:hypothetical protein
MGKEKLKSGIEGYNHAARYGKWVVLADLNDETDCAPLLVRSWLPEGHSNLQFRVAVHEIEAWLLADRRQMADFLKVPEQLLPIRPDDERNPKEALIGAAARSKSKSIREDIAPHKKSSARQGPLYNTRLIEFVERYWDPVRASDASPSLNRSMTALQGWLSK